MCTTVLSKNKKINLDLLVPNIFLFFICLHWSHKFQCWMCVTNFIIQSNSEIFKTSSILLISEYGSPKYLLRAHKPVVTINYVETPTLPPSCLFFKKKLVTTKSSHILLFYLMSACVTKTSSFQRVAWSFRLLRLRHVGSRACLGC